MTTDHSNPSKPRRRWFQFSLRTLLVLVTVLCVFCAWLKVTVERARKQREAIEAMGGTVIYEYQSNDGQEPVTGGSFALAQW